MDPDHQRQLHVVIVGPCASGKSTLIEGLHAQGFDKARVVAQEHSGVRDLWKLHGQPDCLIYLDARLETIAARQHRSDWTIEYLDELLDRLKNARSECDVYLPTDELSIEEVLDNVIECLNEK
jgi:deoxyadenosine/deoxycytidine kinase